MERFSRSELLFGKENMDKLKFAHVLVVGIGGVGGYVCEVLARGGVGNLSIVDFDNVSESNINRQIIALSSTIGRPKVEVMKERIFEINPNCNVLTYNVKVNKETIGRIFDDKFDFVVDAIDDLNGKVLLAKTCQENGIKIISSMGAGNRVSIPNFKIDDLFKTHNDPLSKKFRKLARDNKIESLMVCYSPDDSIKCAKVGSTSFYPSACGITIGAYVIGKLVE